MENESEIQKILPLCSRQINGKWVTINGTLVEPQPLRHWRKTKHRDQSGNFIWIDGATNRQVSQQAPTKQHETWSQRSQRELMEIEEESQRPLRELTEKNARVIREIAEKERWLRADALTKEVDAELLGLLEASDPDDVIDARAEGREFVKRMKARGITMDKEADALLNQIFQFQSSRSNGVRLNADNIEKLFDYCDDLGAFDGHVKRPAPVVAAPTPVPEKFDIEKIQCTGSREIEAAARRAVNDQAWGSESAYSQIYDAWMASLPRLFAGFIPTREQIKVVLDFITQNNLNPHSVESWDKARVRMVAIGHWPAHCLTNDEQLSKVIERVDIDHSDFTPYQKRTEIARLLRLLKGEV
ncbi:MAG: hypothetical protein WCD02_10525 [Terriglobales bacterium]